MNIKHDPMYFRISQDWFNLARKRNQSIYFKFFAIWCSFNALYNLVGEYDCNDDERIGILLNEFTENDASLIINKTKVYCDYFMLKREPIKDMQKSLFGIKQPDDVIKFDDIKRKYVNPDVPNRKKLRYIASILYRVRNNLTHGSKAIVGTDKDVLNNAVPILEKLVYSIGEKVFQIHYNDI